MPDLIPGFVKVTEAGQDYKTSRSTLDRRREAARDSGNAKFFRVFRLRSKDGELFDQPSKEQVAQLTKQGRVPEWYVSRNWLAKEFGKRTAETGESAAQSGSHEPQASAGLQAAVVQQYEERIKDLKDQLNAEREEKKELLQYAQTDKQMFAQAAHQLTQVLALPAIAEANKNRTDATAQMVHESGASTNRATEDRNVDVNPEPVAPKQRPWFLRRLFKRTST